MNISILNQKVSLIQKMFLIISVIALYGCKDPVAKSEPIKKYDKADFSEYKLYSGPLRMNTDKDEFEKQKFILRDYLDEGVYEQILPKIDIDGYHLVKKVLKHFITEKDPEFYSVISLTIDGNECTITSCYLDQAGRVSDSLYSDYSGYTYFEGYLCLIKFRPGIKPVLKRPVETDTIKYYIRDLLCVTEIMDYEYYITDGKIFLRKPGSNLKQDTGLTAD